LVRHGLVDTQQRKRRQSDYRRWERSRAMELWQMDVMGRVRLTDGTELKAVTGSTITHGVPDQILTDIHTESCRDRAVVVQVAA